MWLCAAVIGICLMNSRLAGQVTGTSTTGSADGEVQIQTDIASGKVTILRPTPMEMEVVRKRADSGDAAAQMVVSEAQYALKNLAEGERWLRQAAKTGNVFAQYLLGSDLVFGRHGGVPRTGEGIIFLKLAAYEGYSGAQRELSDCYRLGLGVEKDELEGYGWFLISLRSWPWPEKSASKLRSLFEERLSNEQIEGAKTRAKNFVPTVTNRNPFVDAGMIKLKALSESNGTPLAVINDQAFAVGEHKKVVWLGKSIDLRCLEIRTNSVIVATEPYWQRGELVSPK